MTDSKVAAALRECEEALRFWHDGRAGHNILRTSDGGYAEVRCTGECLAGLYTLVARYGEACREAGRGNCFLPCGHSSGREVVTDEDISFCADCITINTLEYKRNKKAEASVAAARLAGIEHALDEVVHEQRVPKLVAMWVNEVLRDRLRREGAGK